jgi:hypothetical protein
MHRSGTSLCARMLDGLGVHMADEPGISPANLGGHYERPRINDLHDEILALFDRRWSQPTHHLALPDHWWTDPRIDPVREAFVDYLAPRLDAAGRFGFKDPRTSRLLPLWPSILDRLHADPVYVFCVRDPGQVARSLTARDQMGGDQGVYRWLVYNAQAIAGVGTAPVCVIRYEDWFADPAATLDRLARFIGAAPRPGLASLVDDSLRHDALAPSDHVPPIAADLYGRIGATSGAFTTPLIDLAQTILGCERAVMPFLRDAALLPLSINEQNRVIGDLQALVERLRADIIRLKAAAAAEA